MYIYLHEVVNNGVPTEPEKGTRMQGTLICMQTSITGSLGETNQSSLLIADRGASFRLPSLTLLSQKLCLEFNGIDYRVPLSAQHLSWRY